MAGVDACEALRRLLFLARPIVRSRDLASPDAKNIWGMQVMMIVHDEVRRLNDVRGFNQ